MSSNQQSWYGQLPGSYPAEDDQETYLPLMNEISEEEYNAGPRQQSQSSYAPRIPAHQHQYAGQNQYAQGSSYNVPASRQQQYAGQDAYAQESTYQMPASSQGIYAGQNLHAQNSSNQMPASRQQRYAGQNVHARDPSYQTPASRQQPYTGQSVPGRESRYQAPASHQEHYAGKTFPEKQPSYKKPAGRQHPYERPSASRTGNNHQMTACENHRVRQVGPIRHSGSTFNNQGLSNRHLGSNYQQPPAQQHASQRHDGYANSDQSIYDIDNSDFSNNGPPRSNFGNERFHLPQAYSDVPQPFMPEDQSSYQGQPYGGSQSSQDRRFAAWAQKVASVNGPSPYLAASSNAYAASRASSNVAASVRGGRPAAGSVNPEQRPKYPFEETQVDKPKKGKQRATSEVEVSNEAKKPAKPKVKGHARVKNGQLEYCSDPEASTRLWEPAVRMDDCRRELIDQQNLLAAHLGMRYRHPDPVGTGRNDETAFKVEHADWAQDREHLPKICWRYNEDEANHPRPNKDPGYMRFKGMIILDPNDDPVKDWPQLPATLSSKARGYRLEIMSRENPHLEYKDFIARMPSVIEKIKKDEKTGKTEVVWEAPDPNVVCNMRMFRFRKEKGMLSWTEKGKTKTIGEGLEKLFGDKLINNSMEAFGRDLTQQERKEIGKGKDAQFPDPGPIGATKKRKGMATTNAVDQQSNTKVQKAQQQKRPRENDDDVESDDDQNYGQATAASHRKRRMNARGEASRPAINVDNGHVLLATGIAPKDTVAGSNTVSHASAHLSDGSYDEDSDDSLFSLFEDRDEGDEEHEASTSRRPIRPLPARRAGGGVKKVHRVDPAQTRGQEHGHQGDIESQLNDTDDGTDEYVTSPSDTADIPSRGNARPSVEDEANEDEEKDGEDDEERDDEEDATSAIPQSAVVSQTTVVPQASLAPPGTVNPQMTLLHQAPAIHLPPPIPQPPPAPQTSRLPGETDLDLHRRRMREYLGEENDGFFKPDRNHRWCTAVLFP